MNLAKTYHATLLAIALQTRHIVDTLNSAGHAVTSIFMSGGQAKNRELMQLFADVCRMPVVLPADSDGAVVRGAAMLGRFAADAHSRDRTTQAKRLWDIMVRAPGCLSCSGIGHGKGLIDCCLIFGFDRSR